jgi:hypothetical protein
MMPMQEPTDPAASQATYPSRDDRIIMKKVSGARWDVFGESRGLESLFRETEERAATGAASLDAVIEHWVLPVHEAVDCRMLRSDR